MIDKVHCYKCNTWVVSSEMTTRPDATGRTRKICIRCSQRKQLIEKLPKAAPAV